MGNFYISDQFNSAIRLVSGGIISTFAGDGKQGFFGDGGPANQAELSEPVGTLIDQSGEVYIADGANSRIRVVLLDGTITTIAGTGTSGYSGDGGPALSANISFPHAIAAMPRSEPRHPGPAHPDSPPPAANGRPGVERPGIYFGDASRVRFLTLTPSQQPPNE
jgi:hypothetical protein